MGEGVFDCQLPISDSVQLGLFCGLVFKSAIGNPKSAMLLRK
jgi:hypothetical protein